MQNRFVSEVVILGEDWILVPMDGFCASLRNSDCHVRMFVYKLSMVSRLGNFPFLLSMNLFPLFVKGKIESKKKN